MGVGVAAMGGSEPRQSSTGFAVCEHLLTLESCLCNGFCRPFAAASGIRNFHCKRSFAEDVRVLREPMCVSPSRLGSREVAGSGIGVGTVEPSTASALASAAWAPCRRSRNSPACMRAMTRRWTWAVPSNSW